MNDQQAVAELRKLSQLVAEFVDNHVSVRDDESMRVLHSAETMDLLMAFGSWIPTLPRAAKPCFDASHQDDPHWTYDHKVCLRNPDHVFCRKHNYATCPIDGGALR
ncbi:MAG: hypothetical protein AB7S62_13490 [Azoarcus sp.]|jgi:hypothetical protein